MQLARLSRPLAPQRAYGNVPAPFTGATVSPPAPYPRMSAAGAATAMPYMPTPAPAVTTSPMAPFQQSVNQERARNARSAATFAAAAPLPMAPVPAPAMQPTPSPSLMPAAPSAPLPTAGAQPATVPLGQDTPPVPYTPAPTMQYSGAFGTGPQAEQQAQAARAAFVQRQTDVANSQDRGPGLGVNSYANADLQNDANARANAAATTPSAKDEYYEGRAALAKSQAENLVPAQAGLATAKGEGVKAKTENEAQLQPGKVAQQGATLKATEQKGNAAESRALTAAQAVQDRKLSEQIKTIEQKIRGDNRLSESARRAMIHQKIGFLTQKMKIAITAGNRTDDPGGINDQINAAISDLQPKAAPAPATQPAPGAEGTPAPATQPAASALQPTHVNPATGEKWALDPNKNEWVQV